MIHEKETRSIERVEKALEAIRSGKFVILSDHESRENEGDLVMAAQFATPEAINFMATHARGLICLAMDAELIDRLKLPPMVSNNESKLGTAFTVSIGARTGITTGISAYDRAFTVQTAIRDNVSREDLTVPGHVFPLRAREGGVLVRSGHTEGAVDLSRLAGLKASGVICEILKEDGSMARQSELEEFSLRHKIPTLTMEDLIFYRLQKDSSLVEDLGSIKKVSVLNREFEIRLFRSKIDGSEHLAWVLGSIADLETRESLVRVHAEDPLSDYYSPIISDGQDSTFHNSLCQIAEAGQGVLLILRNSKKLSDLYSKNTSQEEAGDGGEMKRFGMGAQILRSIGIRDMALLTRNSKKMIGLGAFGLRITRTVNLACLSTDTASTDSVSPIESSESIACDQGLV